MHATLPEAPHEGGGRPGTGPGARGRVRWVALLALAATCLGIPAWELDSGSWPPPLPAGLLEARALRSGRTTRVLEETLRRHSIAAFRMRPWYDELLYDLFGQTVPEVVRTPGDWLFYAPTVLGYPPPAWREGLREDARLLARLDRALAERGTLLVLIVPPSKASQLPGRVRAARPDFEPVYGELVATLAAQGLLVPELKAAMLPLGDASYHATDTHWTYEGALLSLQAVAAALRARLGPVLPGEPVDAVLTPQPPRPYRGDLHAMLGLPPDGATDRRLLLDLRHTWGLERATGERIEGGPDGALVLTGTSYSLPPVVASILSAVLERRVSDRSILGLGHSAGALEVAYDVLEGRRGAPAVLFWELPERLFLLERAKTFDAVRSFLDARDFAEASSEPLELRGIASAGPGAARLEPRPGGGLEVVAGGGEPSLVLRLPPGLPADGSVALCVRLASDRAGRARLWLEDGEGDVSGEAVPGRAARRDLPQAERGYALTLRLRAPAAGRARLAVDCEERFVLESAELRWLR